MPFYGLSQLFAELVHFLFVRPNKTGRLKETFTSGGSFHRLRLIGGLAQQSSHSPASLKRSCGFCQQFGDDSLHLDVGINGRNYRDELMHRGTTA